ncbi:unnamed protein product, partial [Adineta ricciae]
VTERPGYFLIPVVFHLFRPSGFYSLDLCPNSDERRQRREVRFVRRLLIIAMVTGCMSCPYILFFLRTQIFSNAERLPYAQRVSFIFLSFGYAIWMLVNLTYTDEVRKHLFSKIQCILPQLKRGRVEPGTTTYTNTRVMP